MKIQSLFRNPVYREYPEAVIRRLVCSNLHPPAGSTFETTLLWGDRLTSIYDCDMGPDQWLYGVYDLPTCELIARILSPGDCALDVGANVGQMTLLMSRAVGLTGSVDCFEPHPLIFNILKDNINRSAFKSCITSRQCAISDKDARSRLAIPSTFQNNIGKSSLEITSNGHSFYDVDTYTLDTLFQQKETITLVKVDVEGHEFAVFRGIKALLDRKAIQFIIFEDCNFENSEAAQWLRDFGYHLFAINQREHVVEAPISNPPENPTALNFIALRDLRDVQRITKPKKLTIMNIANNRLQFTFCPGRAKRTWSVVL